MTTMTDELLDLVGDGAEAQEKYGAEELAEEAVQAEEKKDGTIDYFSKDMRWIFHVRRDKAKEFEEKVKDELAHLTSEEWDAWLGPTTDAMPSRKQREKAQDGRPELIVNNHSVAANQLREEIGSGVLSGVFRREGSLVHTPRINEDGYVPPKEGHDGPAQVQQLSKDQLAARVNVRYNVQVLVLDKKASKEAGEDVFCPRAALVPPDTIQTVHEAAGMDEGTPNVRELRGVTHTPVLRPDGSVLHEPGYDTSTRLLYLPDRGLEVPPIPEHPTADDIRQARDQLLFLTEEFPWVSVDHRATWHGLAMLPALRPIIEPPYPFGAITAPNRGSGKGFLARMIRDLHGGVMRVGLPKEAEELRKAITSILLDTTAPVVQFDNLTGIVRSGVMDGLLTTKVWSDRTLGRNKHPDGINDRVWLGTGNNIKVGGDMGRRTVVMEIDPKRPKPWERTGFKMYPPAYVPEHRGVLLAAILTIARGWIESGSGVVEVRSDDYKGLTEVLRSMLAWAEFPGLFGTTAEESEIVEDEDDNEWLAFLVTLYEIFGTEPFTVAQVVEKIATQSLRADAVTNLIDPAGLPGSLAKEWAMTYNSGDSGFAKKLGWWFKNRRGQYVGKGWTVEKVGAGRVARWRVVAGEDAGPAPGKKKDRKKGQAEDGSFNLVDVVQIHDQHKDKRDPECMVCEELNDREKGDIFDPA
jgi:hypothetical protein